MHRCWFWGVYKIQKTTIIHKKRTVKWCVFAQSDGLVWL